MDPDEIEARLGVAAFRKWKCGDRRHTPDGSVLDGHYESSALILRNEVRGTERFFESAQGLLGVLSADMEFMRSFSSGGGTVAINIGLPGDVNIGDEADADLFLELMRLNVKLSIEVFPDY